MLMISRSSLLYRSQKSRQRQARCLTVVFGDVSCRILLIWYTWLIINELDPEYPNETRKYPPNL
jgi:hypothetical protein